MKWTQIFILNYKTNLKIKTIFKVFRNIKHLQTYTVVTELSIVHYLQFYFSFLSFIIVFVFKWEKKNKVKLICKEKAFEFITIR